MGYIFAKNNKKDFSVKSNEELFIKNEITFTSKDLIEFKDTLENYVNRNGQSLNIKDLVKYFNKHFECNKVLDILKTIAENGFKITPKLAFLPTTEKCTVTDGKFVVTKRPLEMNGYAFLNNMVVVRYPNNTFDFFTDVDVDLDTLECDLKHPEVNGVCFVSYNYITDITV